MKKNLTLIFANKKVYLDINPLVTELDKLDDYLSKIRKEKQTKNEKAINKNSISLLFVLIWKYRICFAEIQSGPHRFKCTKCRKKIYPRD